MTTLEWVEVEPVHGARTWELVVTGGDDIIDDLDWLGED